VSGRKALRRIRVIAELPGDLVRHLPLLLRVRRGMRETKDLSALLRSLTPASPVTAGDGGVRGRVRVVRGILRLARFLRVNPNGDCLLRSLAIYAALRERGWPVVLVTGLRREPSGLTGHAWVELDGQVLEELKEPENRARYRVSFRYPPDGEAEPVREEAGYSPTGAGGVRPG
jgi:hypothetical protein